MRLAAAKSKLLRIEVALPRWNGHFASSKRAFRRLPNVFVNQDTIVGRIVGFVEARTACDRLCALRRSETRAQRPTEPAKCRPRGGGGLAIGSPPPHRGLHFKGLEVCRLRVSPNRNGPPQVGTFRLDETRISMKCVGCLIACAFRPGEMHENMSASVKQAIIDINFSDFFERVFQFSKHSKTSCGIDHN